MSEEGGIPTKARLLRVVRGPARADADAVEPSASPAKPLAPLGGAQPLPLDAAPTAPEEFARFCRQLVDEIAGPGWAASIDAQAKGLQLVGWHWQRFSQPVRDAIQQTVCQQLQIPVGRFEYLVGVEELADLRRALEWAPTPMKLLPEEQQYPSEGWIGAYLEYASAGEAHRGFHFWAAIAVLGAACRRNFFINAGGHSALYPNHYVLLEGPPGCGKTTAIHRAMDVLERANRRLSRTADGRTDHPSPSTIHVLPKKVSSEELVKVLRENARRFRPLDIMLGHNDNAFESCGIFAVDELTTLLGKDTTGSDRLMGTITALYDGSFDESTLKRGHVSIQNVSLTCLFGSTMEWLRSQVTDQIFKGGFLGARCIMISKQKTPRRYARQPLTDPVQRDYLASELCRLAEHEAVELRLTPEADRWFEDWYMALPHGAEDPRLAAFTERKDIHLLKLAMVLTVSEGRGAITRGCLEQAVTIQRMEEVSMMAAVQQIGGGNAIENEHMEYVLDVVKRHGGRVDHTTLVNAVRWKLGTRKRILEALETLVMAGRLFRVVVATRGPARTDWVLAGHPMDGPAVEEEGEADGDDGSGDGE